MWQLGCANKLLQCEFCLLVLMLLGSASKVE
jgi:hypothetical protein